MKMNKAVKSAPMAKNTKVTTEHLWSNNAKVTPEKANIFDGSKNTTDKISGSTQSGWSPTA